MTGISPFAAAKGGTNGPRRVLSRDVQRILRVNSPRGGMADASDLNDATEQRRTAAHVPVRLRTDLSTGAGNPPRESGQTRGTLSTRAAASCLTARGGGNPEPS